MFKGIKIKNKKYNKAGTDSKPSDFLYQYN
jgi:hypothetical protein